MFSIDDDMDRIMTACKSYNLSSILNIEVLKSGTANKNIKIVTKNGTYLLRKKNHKYSDIGQVLFDHSIIVELYRNKLPVPLLLNNIFGSSYTIVNDKVYELFSFIEGSEYKQDNVEQLKNSGEILMKMHKVLVDFIPKGIKLRPRYDSPDKIRIFLDSLNKIDLSAEQTHILGKLKDESVEISREYVKDHFNNLKCGIIHGDYHPDNVQYDGNQVCGIFDFDWTGFQPLIRDIADGILFFAGEKTDIERKDIIGLTQSRILKETRIKYFLESYAKQTLYLTELDVKMLPYAIKTRWLCCRIDGTTKVMENDKISFFFNDIWPTIKWINSKKKWIIEIFNKLI